MKTIENLIGNSMTSPGIIKRTSNRLKKGAGRIATYLTAGAFLFSLGYSVLTNTCCAPDDEGKSADQRTLISDDDDNDNDTYVVDDDDDDNDNNDTGDDDDDNDTTECVEPYAGMIIERDTTLCPGEYYLPADHIKAIITIRAPPQKEVNLNCNGSKIIGSNICNEREFEGEEWNGAGIFIEQNDPSSSVNIQNCDIQNYCMGIDSLLPQNLIISNNNLQDNPERQYSPAMGDNIQIASGTNVIISNNTIDGGENEGIYLAHSAQNVEIVNNHISNTLATGIATYCDGSCNSIWIRGNNIREIAKEGINLIGINPSNLINFEIRDNQIINVGQEGISLERISMGNISGNFIERNTAGDYALNVKESDNLNIWNNYFRSPLTWVVRDTGNENAWNNTINCSEESIVGGKCTGGNFYSDYIGTDTNGDGIGEANYNISGTANSIDNLPLVSQKNSKEKIR